MKPAVFWLLAGLLVQGLAACAIPGNGQAGSASTSSPARQNLTEYHWLMQPDFDPNRAPVQLTFQDERLQVQGLCNNIGAGYSIAGPRMTIADAVSTMRLCDDPALMRYEQRVANQFEKTVTWSIAGADTQQGPTLSLSFGDGHQWLLHGKQTHEAMYGPPETVFLEIGPELVPCDHTSTTNKNCLQTRAITYDDAGLKVGQGEWEVFYDDVEGYTHSPGVRNVLRLKRYTRAAVPAHASAYVHVLDMVVESESVR